MKPCQIYPSAAKEGTTHTHYCETHDAYWTPIFSAVCVCPVGIAIRKEVMHHNRVWRGECVKLRETARLLLAHAAYVPDREKLVAFLDSPLPFQGEH